MDSLVAVGRPLSVAPHQVAEPGDVALPEEVVLILESLGALEPVGQLERLAVFLLDEAGVLEQRAERPVVIEGRAALERRPRLPTPERKFAAAFGQVKVADARVAPLASEGSLLVRREALGRELERFFSAPLREENFGFVVGPVERSNELVLVHRLTSSGVRRRHSSILEPE